MNTTFFVSEEIHRVKLPSDNWVDVKKEMSLADWDRYEQDQVSIVRGEDSAQGYFHRSDITLLEINIVAWSFDVAVTRENIGKLRRRWSEKIIKEIDQLNLTKEELEEAKAKM